MPQTRVDVSLIIHPDEVTIAHDGIDEPTAHHIYLGDTVAVFAAGPSTASDLDDLMTLQAAFMKAVRLCNERIALLITEEAA